MTKQMQPSFRKLHIGCGADIKEGWVNLDIASIPGVDVVHNIEDLPLPFANGSFDEVLCRFILEHVDWVPVLRDIYRIMAPGAKLQISVPHFTSKQNFTDPQHKRLFSIETFDFFIPSTKTWQTHSHYFDFSFNALPYRHITFELSSRIFFFNRFVEKWVNKTRYRQQLYESLFLSRLFPAENIHFTIVK
jgi:SAM-dependent methyltransferase